MKRRMLFLLICMLLQGMHIVLSKDCNQQSTQPSIGSAAIFSEQTCTLHECMQNAMQDLTWFEWLQKMFESCMLRMQIVMYKMLLYVCAQNMYKQISLLQEKLAENAAELGYLDKALYYSQEGLHSSVQFLIQFEDQICRMQKSDQATLEAIEKVRDQIIKYTQHVQSHILTMTDFASDEKNSISWQLYEKILMHYFEKMQQVMQNIDECDELLCQHDVKYCASASQQAALLAVTEDCMSSDFDPDVYD